MNVELLRKLQAYILEDTGRINMEEGLCTFSVAKADLNHSKRPLCGTVGCIAGNVLVLCSGVKPRKGFVSFQDVLDAFNIVKDSFVLCVGAFHGERGIREKAIELLNFDNTQADRLFVLSNWPDYFITKIVDLRPGTKKYAKVISDRIDHFIATEGRE